MRSFTHCGSEDLLGPWLRRIVFISRTAYGNRDISPFRMCGKGYSSPVSSISTRCQSLGSRQGRSSSRASSRIRAMSLSKFIRTESSPGIWNAERLYVMRSTTISLGLTDLFHTWRESLLFDHPLDFFDRCFIFLGILLAFCALPHFPDILFHRVLAIDEIFDIFPFNGETGFNILSILQVIGDFLLEGNFLLFI